MISVEVISVTGHCVGENVYAVVNMQSDIMIMNKRQSYSSILLLSSLKEICE